MNILGTVFEQRTEMDSDSFFLKQLRLYAFDKFKCCDLTSKQCHYFIQLLILPILLYDSELRDDSCTADLFTKSFELVNYASDIELNPIRE